MPDVVVIGAGAAGLAAARRLSQVGVQVLVLEARSRVGGRARTVVDRSGSAVDLGCGWLHSADQNPLAKLVEPLGFTLDRTKASWSKPALDVNFPAEDQRAYREVLAAFERRLDAAADAPDDQPASALFGPDEQRWKPLLNAFSGYYNGAPFGEISVKDYAAYQPTPENWRITEGYGALIAALADGLDVRLGHPVRRIEHRPNAIRVSADGGEIEAQMAIVCLPTAVLAREAIVFDPPLPAKIEAANALPLGHVEKAFLRLRSPEDFPVETRVHGRIDTTDTAGYTLRPLGMPVVECYFGGDLAAALGAEEPGALAAFAEDELAALFGSRLRGEAELIAESRWASDPFTGGGYSHARVGQATARARLAEPVGGRLLFAGEACSAHAFSTAHGAYETGVAAADVALGILGLPSQPHGRP